jgi:hypothetical protein
VRFLEELSRNEIIHAKGFNMRNDGNSYYSEAVPAEYRKVKVGVKNLDDAVLNLGSIKQALGPHGYTNKAVVFKALADHDL